MALSYRGMGLSLSLLRPRTVDCAVASELYDSCGERLFRLAHLVTGDTAAASAAVVTAFELAYGGSTLVPSDRRAWHELARLTYAACREPDVSPPSRNHDTWPAEMAPVCCMRTWFPQQRALLALTMHGDHDYREAATLIGLEPRWAAALLRGTLGACEGAQSARLATHAVPPC